MTEDEKKIVKLKELTEGYFDALAFLTNHMLDMSDIEFERLYQLMWDHMNCLKKCATAHQSEVSGVDSYTKN